MAKRVPARLTPKEGRRFGFTVGTAFLAFGGVVWWRGHSTVAGALAFVGIVLIMAAVAVPGRLGPVHHAWMTLAAVISRVTTPVILAVIYFAVLTPTGVIRRLVGRNPVKRGPSTTGFWIPRPPGTRSRQDMEHQF